MLTPYAQLLELYVISIHQELEQGNRFTQVFLRKFKKVIAVAFYDNFRKLCYEKGESPTSVGKKLGLSSGTVSNWKAVGSTPQGPTVRKIAEYFGVSADYLLTGEEPTYTAIRTADPDVEIFERINALKREDLRRLVLRLSEATEDEIRKVHGFLDLTQIGGSYEP